MNRPAVRAGLIGGAAAVVVALLGLIPVCGCFSWLLTLVVFLGSGLLAARWLPAPRQAGPAAAEGAIAGVIAGAANLVINMLLAPLGVALSGGPQSVLSQVPAEYLKALADAGIDPSSLVNTGSILGVAACCGIVGVVFAAGLGALGGVIYGGAKPQ
jgi:hypothetical protein